MPAFPRSAQASTGRIRSAALNFEPMPFPRLPVRPDFDSYPDRQGGGALDRRAFLRAGVGVVGAMAIDPGAALAAGARGLPLQLTRPVPSPAQLSWHRDELTMFVHFGINTFTNREWGDGTEDPAIFNPGALDARQWARAARDGGFRLIILTAKHHDGFCLWPTDTTRHSIASSPWRAGQGDLVREFVDAARAEGLKVGLYLSPWDRNAPSYGDSPRYNDLYVQQLTELLTRYGTIAEVWFDGANGEGPNGRRQEYDWPRFRQTVRTLQPGAIMFSDAGPDIRWIGNERGIAGDPNWSTVDPAVVPYPGMSGPGVREALQHGHPNGTVWRPGEADVSIRPGWFWHPEQDDEVRQVENLIELYFLSVGRNANLLLNVPPTTDGLFHPTDVERLRGFREQRERIFATDLARVGRASASSGGGASRVLDGDFDSFWSPAGGARSGYVELDFPAPVQFDVVELREAIAEGQHVERYEVHALTSGGWTIASGGSTIGNRKLDRLDAPVTAHRLRLSIESALDVPRISAIRLYRAG
jgi:alpha-L-fucosidase